MHLHGPICICNRSSPMASLGPVDFLKGVADALAWAHPNSLRPSAACARYASRRSGGCTRIGPYALTEITTNGLAWAR